MGFLTEVAMFFIFLIGLYAGLHDFLGLNIISYELFDTYIGPSFVSFLFIAIASFTYWLYRINNKPLNKNTVKILQTSVAVFALGIFFTAQPLEASSTFKLILGKLLLLAGLALGSLVARVHKQVEKVAKNEVTEINTKEKQLF